MPLEGNSLKGALYRALKAEGAELGKSYAQYTVPELQAAYAALVQAGMVPKDVEQHPANGQHNAIAAQVSVPDSIKLPPRAYKDPNEMAGQRLNQKDPDEPIRVDPDTGFIWFQEEILKPAFPKPRGRRVLRYLERGTKQVTVKNGDYTETFEIAGDQAAREQEVRVTLPSYQVGLYKDPRFPFKIHVYNGRRGFDLFEVQKYYGGAELVPAECKKIYVENVLCYDPRTVIRQIQTEYRQLQLQGGRR
jgi:hypothetical protein